MKRKKPSPIGCKAVIYEIGFDYHDTLVKGSLNRLLFLIVFNSMISFTFRRGMPTFWSAGIFLFKS